MASAPAAFTLPQTSGDSCSDGKKRLIDLRRLQHFVRPFALRDVEHQRAGSVGHVDGALAGQAEANVILRQHHERTRFQFSRFVFAHPEKFRQREIRERRIAGELNQPIGADALGQLAALLARCGRRTRSAPGERLRRARRASRRRASGRRSRRRRSARRCSFARSERFARRGAAARHQSSGRCSAQPICGDANGSCSSVAEARILPSAPMIRARVPPVPTSMPRTYFRMSSGSIARVRVASHAAGRLNCDSEELPGRARVTEGDRDQMGPRQTETRW